MAPNIVDGDISEVPELKEKGKLEVLYNGYFYDVTNFVGRHPGGGVIKFYTERGEDATQAIEQFHYRSKNKIELMLKSFKRRPAESHEIAPTPKALTRHEALSADFKKLFEELQAEGYFKPSIRHVILRMLEGISFVIMAHNIFVACETFPTQFLAVMLVGFAYSRFGWIAHEGGHNSLTGMPRVDKMLQTFSMSFVLGGSAMWWNSMHNRHHAMPQRLQHDVDLSQLPYLAFNKGEVKDKKKINRFFIRYQAILYSTLDIYLLMLAYKFYIYPRYQLKKKAYHEMLLILPNYYLMYHYGLFWYFTAAYWFAFFLATNFQLNHSHLEAATEPTHWIEYSLTHTADITPSLLVDYWMGYLNYQTEHHLFPTMPQFRQREVSHRVKALAEKHGLPYRVFGYWEASKLVIQNLDKVAKELTQ